MRAYLPALVLLSFASVACGGTDEGRLTYEATETGEVDSCRADRGYEFLSLIDFEPHEVGGGDLSTNVACNPELASTCDFYFNYDYRSSPPNTQDISHPRGEDCVELAVDEGAEVFTSPRIASTFPAQEIPDGRCGNEGYGLNIITENVGMCYGADGRLGWGAALDVTFSEPLDASDWDGVALWMKKAEGSQKPAFILQFVDPNTSGTDDPETGDTALCDASDPSTALDSQKCDSFGTAITLTDEWSFVAVRFEDLAQKGFGAVSPLGRLKVDEIIRMQIFVNAGSADFWLDDFSLFREAP